MLHSSEIVKRLKSDLKGFKIAWDAGQPIDSQDWLIGFPKLQIERKVKEIACDDLKKWIKEWKTQRAGIEQVFGMSPYIFFEFFAYTGFFPRHNICSFWNFTSAVEGQRKRYSSQSRKPLYHFIRNG